jgi:hypothetical protein
VDVFVPLVADRDPNRYVRNSVNFLRFLGRLNPGISGDRAQAELTTICGSLRQQFPVEYARKYAVRTVPLREALIGDYRESMMLLLGAVLVVLCTALANLVSLVLVRANERRAEWSIRVAIGAPRLHLVRQLMVESTPACADRQWGRMDVGSVGHIDCRAPGAVFDSPPVGSEC